MIEKYFTFKLLSKIIPLVLLILILTICMCILLLKKCREKRNKKYLIKNGFEYYLTYTNIWAYRKNNLIIYDNDLSKYSLFKLRKMIKKEEK